MTNKWKIRIFFWVYILFLWIFVRGDFDFLALNTFLGYLPIEFSFQMDRIPAVKSWLFLLVFLLWLLFYPNAPYVLTDLFHLSLLHPYNQSTGLMKDNPAIWLNYTYMIISALSCSILCTIELKKVCQRLANQFLPKVKINPLPLILIILSSIGIYMGRFLRIHSFYILLTPTWFIKQIIDMWTPSMWAFTFFLTIVQLALYWLVNHSQNQSSS